MKNYTIDEWFPKAIYIKDNFCNNLNIQLKNSILREYKNKKYVKLQDFYVDSSHKVNDKLHLNKDFLDFSKLLILEIQNFLLEYGYNEHSVANVIITNMWYNISDKGGFNFPHNHNDSLISGVYYLMCDERNIITFYENLNQIKPTPDNFTKYSYSHVDYVCKKNRLMLFSGSFVHANPIQTFSGKKIIISFNSKLC